MLGAAALPPGRVLAASIAVDKTADDDANGTCTLWDAITAANTDTSTDGCTDGSGADTITLTVNITLVDYRPAITTEITIEGANHDIDGNDRYPMFYVDDGDLTVNNITLTGGKSSAYGGAINADGGSLTVTNAQLEDNAASLLGGAIAASNTDVIIRNGVFVANYSGSLGGALDLAGGEATIRRSSFIGNKAGTGGGAINASARAFLFENNTISCNTADADGGGMYVIVGDLILKHSTIYLNSARDEGGGLYSIADSEHYPEDVEVSWGLYLQNSIIAGSKGGGGCVAQDEIDDNIGMYVGDGTCEPACSGDDGPINLGELQGEPAYHPLLDGSVAINRADVEVCSLPEPTETPASAHSQTCRARQAQDFSDTNICEELAPQQDQFGTIRPIFGNCDIGAIESRTAEEYIGPRDVTTTYTPTTASTPTNTVDAATERTLQETREAAQTAVNLTADAGATETDAAQATETAIANLPPADQDGAAEAFATETAAAAPTRTEEAKWMQTEATAQRATASALPSSRP